MTVLSPRYPPSLDTPWRQPRTRQHGGRLAATARGRRNNRFTRLALGLLCGSLLPCMPSPHGRRQNECSSNLKSIYVAIRTTQAPRLGVSPTLNSFGFEPERGNRYAYFLGPGPLEDRGAVDAVQAPAQMGIGVDLFKYPQHRALTLNDIPPEIARQVRLWLGEDSYEFVAACAGDIDNNVNDAPDVWTISSQRRMIGDEPVEPGEPYRHVNDATSN